MLVLLLDQLSKLIVVRSIPLHDSIVVIPRFFRISHVLNPGAAFSLFADSTSPWTTWILVGFGLAVIAGVTYVLWNASGSLTRTNIGLSFVLGGAAGNLMDRLLIGKVVDFLAFNIGSYHWPDFNVADSAVVVGAALLMFDLFFHPKEENAV